MKKLLCILIAVTVVLTFTMSIYAVSEVDHVHSLPLVTDEAEMQVTNYKMVTCPFCGKIMGLECGGTITSTTTQSFGCAIGSHNEYDPCIVTQYYAITIGTCRICGYNKGVTDPAWPFEFEHRHYEIHIPNGDGMPQTWNNCSYY